MCRLEESTLPDIRVDYCEGAIEKNYKLLGYHPDGRHKAAFRFHFAF